MRILHTSDWHIGQKLHNEDRREEHLLFFDWLVETVKVQQVDVVLIAGDIFDVGYPSNQALNDYYSFLTRLQKTCCKAIVISGGNHDSVSTLNAPKKVLELLNVHVIGGATQDIKDEIIPIYNDDGNVELVVCAVPFLRDRDIRKSIAGESYEDKINAIKNGISGHYQSLAEHTTNYRLANIPVVAMGHLYVAGISASDSERDIYIGNLGQIDAGLFPEEFDYYALGHIHRPQKVAKNEKIRYSGSPLQLSFSERKNRKIVIIIEFSENKQTEISEIEVPLNRNLLRIEGDLLDVQNKILTHKKTCLLSDWAEIVIFDNTYNQEIRSKFEKTLEQLPESLSVLKYRFASELSSDAEDIDTQESTLNDFAVTDIFQRKLQQENIADTDDLMHSFSQLLEELNLNT